MERETERVTLPSRSSESRWSTLITTDINHFLAQAPAALRVMDYTAEGFFSVYLFVVLFCFPHSPSGEKSSLKAPARLTPLWNPLLSHLQLPHHCVSTHNLSFEHTQGLRAKELRGPLFSVRPESKPTGTKQKEKSICCWPEQFCVESPEHRKQIKIDKQNCIKFTSLCIAAETQNIAMACRRGTLAKGVGVRITQKSVAAKHNPIKILAKVLERLFSG